MKTKKSVAHNWQARVRQLEAKLKANKVYSCGNCEKLEKEVALLQDVEVHLQVCENNKKALVDICEQYKQENKRLKSQLSKDEAKK